MLKIGRNVLLEFFFSGENCKGVGPELWEQGRKDPHQAMQLNDFGLWSAKRIYFFLQSVLCLQTGTFENWFVKIKSRIKAIEWKLRLLRKVLVLICFSHQMARTMSAKCETLRSEKVNDFGAWEWFFSPSHQGALLWP